MGNSLSITFKRVREFFSREENLEDFLTGALLTEMVQNLQTTQKASTRSELPLRFTNPFIVSNNNVKAIAYAFDIKDSNGHSIVCFEKEEQKTSIDSHLLDVSINGKLALPSLSLGKHAASILSTSILVSEQMFLEQMMKEAMKASSAEEVEKLLKEVIGNNSTGDLTQIAKELFELASNAPTNERGVILGLQFDYCDKMVSLLRKTFKFDKMLDLIEILEREEITTDEALSEFLEKNDNADLEKPLEILYRIGNLIQNNPSTSAASVGSRGILSGLEILIQKIAPSTLGEKLGIRIEDYQVPSLQKGKKNEALQKEIIATQTAKPFQTVLSPQRVFLALLIFLAFFSSMAMYGQKDANK